VRQNATGSALRVFESVAARYCEEERHETHYPESCKGKLRQVKGQLKEEAGKLGKDRELGAKASSKVERAFPHTAPVNQLAVPG